MSADTLLINGGAGFLWMIWTGTSPPGNVILRAELQEGEITFVFSCQNKAARSGGRGWGGQRFTPPSCLSLVQTALGLCPRASLLSGPLAAREGETQTQSPPVTQLPVTAPDGRGKRGGAGGEGGQERRGCWRRSGGLRYKTNF